MGRRRVAAFLSQLFRRCTPVKRVGTGFGELELRGDRGSAGHCWGRMGLVAKHAERRYTFAKTLKKVAVTAAVTVALASGAWFSTHKVAAGGETRTVSLYHVH